VRIWDTQRWETVLSFVDIHSTIYGLQFSPDGNHLYLNAPEVDFRRYSSK
jgi:WD40 repeat protein